MLLRQHPGVPSLNMDPAREKGQWGQPMKFKHKYQPRIQEWGLAEARVRVQRAAGGEIAQRESTYKKHRIREREQVVHPGGQLGHTCPPSLQTTPTHITLKKGPLQGCTAAV